jgi:hypothetical protein
MLAEHLKADLQRIASTANDELKIIRRAGRSDSGLHAAEARVIDEARARAVRRVESTIRHLRTLTGRGPAAYPRPNVGQGFVGADMEKTQVIPAVAAAEPPVDVPEPTGTGRHAVSAVGDDDEPEQLQDPRAADAVEPAPAPQPRAAEAPTDATTDTKSDGEQLRQLLTFVARQEPRLNWAVGEYADGTTVLVTDLAHGWIPPAITLPAGVRLLEPGRRPGGTAALVGDATCMVTYGPGDPLGASVDSASTGSSVQPRELPAVEDLGWVLGAATHWRDGLPRVVHTLAKAAAAGTGVVEAEVDLLRVHSDTARYQLFDQYPNVDPALLLNCLLLAATEGLVTGDAVSANYHLAWFQKLDAPAASRWPPNP